MRHGLGIKGRGESGDMKRGRRNGEKEGSIEWKDEEGGLSWVGGARNVDSSGPPLSLPIRPTRSNGVAAAAEKANSPVQRRNAIQRSVGFDRSTHWKQPKSQDAHVRSLGLRLNGSTPKLHPHAAYRPMFERGYIRCIHGGGELSLKKNGLRK